MENQINILPCEEYRQKYKDLLKTHTKYGEIFLNESTNEICFGCFICAATVNHAMDFENHLMQHFEDIEDVEENLPLQSTKTIKMEIEENMFDEYTDGDKTEEIITHYMEMPYCEKSNSMQSAESDEDIRFPFSCDCCDDLKFPCNGVLKEHIVEKQGLNGYFCQDCTAIYFSAPELRRHMDAHEIENPMECDFCSEQIIDRQTWLHHLGWDNEPSDQTDSRTFEEISISCDDSSSSNEDFPSDIYSDSKCEESEIETESETERERETEVETETEPEVFESVEIFYCDICEERFNKLETLKNHFKSFHDAVNIWNEQKNDVLLPAKAAPIKKKLICDVCNRSCINFTDLKTHLKEQHNNMICGICDIVFKRKRQLNDHIKQHYDDDEHCYKCLVCKKIYKTKENLTQHMRVHSGEKPYACKICNKRFNHSSYINIHMRIHTKEKPYKCSICTASFISKSKLTCHEKAHNNIRPHGCKVCGRSFRSPADLRDHTRSEHTNERPFECNICNRGFAKHKLLAQHKLLHDDARKYKCRYCSMAFSQAAGRHGHEKRTHSN